MSSVVIAKIEIIPKQVTHYLSSGMPEADPDKDSCGRSVYISGDISKA